MQVILLEPINRLGNVGDVVSVKNGFGRNFLIPEGKALRATNENKEIFEKERKKIEANIAEKQKEAEALAEKVTDVFAVVTRQASEDGRLFGSVAARDVSAALSEKISADVPRASIIIHEPIKRLGVYSITLRLHAKVTATAFVNVARNEDEAKDAEELFKNPPAPEAEVEAALAEAAAAAAAEKAAGPGEFDESFNEDDAK